MVQHGHELDDNQKGEGQDEHEAQGVDVHVLAGELQAAVHLRHPDEDGRRQELEGEGHHEPEGVADEVDEGDLHMNRDETVNFIIIASHSF